MIFEWTYSSSACSIPKIYQTYIYINIYIYIIYCIRNFVRPACSNIGLVEARVLDGGGGEIVGSRPPHLLS